MNGILVDLRAGVAVECHFVCYGVAVVVVVFVG
jgi:hypothetical protein